MTRKEALDIIARFRQDCRMRGLDPDDQFVFYGESFIRSNLAMEDISTMIDAYWYGSGDEEPKVLIPSFFMLHFTDGRRDMLVSALDEVQALETGYGMDIDYGLPEDGTVSVEEVM